MKGKNIYPYVVVSSCVQTSYIILLLFVCSQDHFLKLWRGQGPYSKLVKPGKVLRYKQAQETKKDKKKSYSLCIGDLDDNTSLRLTRTSIKCFRRIMS